MAAPTMRRLVPALLAIGILAVHAPSAPAQDLPAVRLTLLSQTAWNSPWHATNQREVVLRFRAENLDDAPVGDLSIGVTLYGRVLSRTAYEQALVADPSFALDAETFGREGRIEPGQVRDFEVTFSLEGAGVDPDDSGIYPMKIDLRSGFASIAAIRTPVIFLVREPVEPLRLSWTVVLHHPISFRPDGVFVTSDLEGSLASGGRLAAQIRALLEVTTETPQRAVDVAISPLLLLQLERMRDGYEVAEPDGGVLGVRAGEGGAALAAQALEDLRAIARAPNVRMSAMPFASPEVPALVAGGLGRDLVTQLERGRDAVAETLQTTPVAGTLRPPGAALDEDSLNELSALGLSTLVVNASTVVVEPHPLGFAGSPAAALDDAGSLRAVVPDPAVTALMQSPTVDEDPVLAAQAVLGELATIWQEQPGELRGVALVLSEDLLVPPPFFPALARAVARAPWLAPMHAGEFTAQFSPPEPAALASTVARRFSTSYVVQLKQARRRVDTYRSMLVEPSPRPDRFDEMLLLAESRQYLSNPDDGLAFIGAIRALVEGVFDAISVESIPVITLTSSSGSGIPVTVRNGSDEAIRIGVQLVSPDLRGTPSIDLELAPGESQDVTFTVEVRSSGRFEVELQVVAPGGRIIGRPQTLVVRSTVYNRIALVITVSAALLLLALWARRFVPRRTS